MQDKGTVRVVSHQYTDGDVNRSQNMTQCRLSLCDDRVIAVYNDDLGDGTVTQCSLDCSEKELIITRTGSVKTVIDVLPGGTKSCIYTTQFGDIPLTVTGKSISFVKTENKAETTAYYYLSFGDKEDNILNKVKITIWFGDIENEQHN